MSRVAPGARPARRWLRRALLAAVCAALLLLVGSVAWLERDPPTLLGISPERGAADVPLAAALTLTFDQPMDRASVVAALRLQPPLPLGLAWSADSTQLTLQPAAPLRADTAYTLTLSADARSRWLRPLADVASTFRTIPAPAVLLRFPPDGAQDVRQDTPLVLVFSRPMVGPDTVGAAVDLPQLRFDPPLTIAARWLDARTLLLQPDTLRAATAYTATLAADLADRTRLPLGQDVSWRFATAAPQLLALNPADGAREVSRAAPLVLRLSQPLDVEALRAGLVITPTTAGMLAASALPDATQLITFTPSGGWRAGAAYDAALTAGIAPVTGERPLPGPVRWSFRVASAPQIVGRFPGRGQRLPPGQSLRLVLSTPFAAETIRAAATITPTVSALRVLASGTEVRFAGDLRADTVYTLTLPADMAALSGETLGVTATLQFATDRALPTIAVPGASGRVSQVQPLSPTLQIDATGVTALAAEIYRLDQTTAVRTFGFGPDDWRGFSPQRYGLRLLRSWTTPVSPTGALQLDLTDPPGAALDPGFYSLRLRAAEGPQTDLLLVASSAQLVLVQGLAGTLLLARNTLTDAPIPAAPIALYQNGALVAVTGTDAVGQAVVGPVGDQRRPLLALLDGPFPALASADWGDQPPAPPPPAVTLLTDRDRYQPGERVLIGGFAPPGSGSALLALRAPGQTDPLTATVRIGPSGVISAVLNLPVALPPDTYQMTLVLDGVITSRALAVDPPPSVLQLRAVAAQLPDGTLPVTLTALTRWDAPAAGAVISWTLDAERPDPEGLARRGGAGRAARDGHLTLVLTDALALTQPLAVRLTALASDPGGTPAAAEQRLTLVPPIGTLTAQLERRVWAAGAPQTLSVTALRSDGEPYAGLALRAEAIRRVWPAGAAAPDETVAVARALRTDADGRATLPLTLGRGGEYTIRVSAARPDGPAPVELTAWVAAPGFTLWRPPVGDRVPLITDRASYRAGETVTLLAAAPLPGADALLALRRGAALSTLTQTLRAGDLITLTLRADDPPALELTALLSAPGRTLLAETAIRLDASARQLRLTVQTEPASDPAHATLLFSTTDTLGQPLAASLLLTLGDGDPPDPPDVAAPPELPSVAWVGGETRRGAQRALPERRVSPLAADTQLWRADLRTGPDGTLRLTVALSGTGALTARVWAHTPGRAPVFTRLALRTGPTAPTRPPPAVLALPAPQAPSSGAAAPAAVAERLLLDPVTGAPLDPQRLTAGQLVAVQFVVVTSEQPLELVLHEPLPPWGDLIGPGTGDFDRAERDATGLVLRRSSSVLAVLRHRYLVRVGLPGRYQSPPPLVAVVPGSPVSAGRPLEVTVR